MSFIKRHKKLSLLFVISVFFMIKNSSIPYFFNPPALVAFIFDAPKSEFFSSIAQMVNLFASAYVTSLLFYYMVDYLPAIKQENKAKEIVSPKLVDLYLYMSEFLAMIEYSARKQGVYSLNETDVMDKLTIKSTEVLCKKKSYKNGSENGTAAYSYSLLKNGDQFRSLILNTCNEIFSTPSFSFCDKQVIDLISEIHLSELLRMWPKPDDCLIQFNVEFHGLGKGYQHLKTVSERLSDFVDTCISCEMIDISPEEIESWQRDQVELLGQYPEIAEMLVTFLKNNK
ncbi:MAG: hypothetical protein IKL57_01740 [Oscillospiraceae bacterium]|nr:hypothetical protein [Oscillospiraceae bacterium]